MATKPKAPIPAERIANSILVIRGHRVMLDEDLGALYGVPTKRFNEAVKRNEARFPADFMFVLSDEEFAALRSQFATSNAGGRGGRRYPPRAFTEHGAIMAATILNSARAVEMSVYVVRAFVRLREMLAANKELAKQFAALEARIDKRLAAQDETIVEILQAIRKLMEAPPLAPTDSRPKRKIGFV